MAPTAREEFLDRLGGLLAGSPDEVIAAYLYGSRARGTERESSDVDVGLLLTRPPEPVLGNVARRLEGELERATGLAVHAVVLNAAPVDLVHRVLRDGLLLLDRDPLARAAFEVRVRNEFFDLEPHLRRYREAWA